MKESGVKRNLARTSFSILFLVWALTTVKAQEVDTGIDPNLAFMARISGLFMIEDPTSLYDFDISDRRVEFILDGSWEIKLEGVTDISFDDGTPIIATTPPVFSQTVDLSSWVFIDNTWYFESTFTEQFTKNTVAAGYLGGETDIVKHIRLGNSGIVFPGDYPFVDIGGGTALAPGIMATFAGDTWSADAILRYDAASARQMTLAGMNEVTDEYVPITDLVQDKWFVLPDAPITGSVTVYVTSPDGPIKDAKNRRWRALNPAEFRVSGLDGTIELLSRASGSVAVFYAGTYASDPITPDTGLRDFLIDTRAYFSASVPANILDAAIPPDVLDEIADRFLLQLEGNTALILRETGYFSPFALSSRYAATGTDLEAVFRESGVTPDYLLVDAYDSSWAELRWTGTTDIRSTEARFPLVGLYPLLYFPAWGGHKPDTDLAIRSRGYKPVTTLSLGENVIAGTIQVTRDGISDTAFTLDESTGILTLANQPQLNENVRITWFDSDPAARNATVSLGGGIRWKAREALSLTAASALRWNISKSGYTDYSDLSPGSLLLSTGAAYAGTNITASTAFAFELSVADTTGFYRVSGMDTSPDSLYPSPSWYRTTVEGFEPVLGAPFDSTDPLTTLDDADRANLDGTDGDSPPTITDSSVSGTVLTMNVSLPTDDNWAAADILTGTMASTDFRTVQTLTIALKNTGTDADFDIFLQLGISDTDDYEDAGTVRTWLLGTPAAGAGWTVRSVNLTDADRRALTAGGNVRLIVRPKTLSSPVDVRLRSGPLELTESGFQATASPTFTTGSASAREIHDPSSPTLASVQSEIVNRFNSGGVNTVLEATFTPDQVPQTVSMSRNFPAIPLDSYNFLSFFMNPGTLPAGSARIRFTLSRPDDSSVVGAEDKALEFEIDAAAGILTANAWQKLTVDLTNRTVSRDGSPIAATITEYHRSVVPTHLSIDFVDWPSGTEATVLLDEWYLEETDPDYTVQNKSTFAWSKAGALLSRNDKALVSEASISLTSVTSHSLKAGTTIASGSASGGLNVLKTRADASITVSSTTGRLADSTSHTVTVPFGPLILEEQFAPDFIGNVWRRRNSVALSGPVSAGVDATVQLKGRNLERTASAHLSPALPTTPIGRFSVNIDSTFGQTGPADQPVIEDSAWTGLWQDSFLYSLSTGESDAFKRNGKTNMRLQWAGESGGRADFRLSEVTLDLSGSSAYTSNTTTTVGSSLSFTLALPFKIFSTTLTPSWQRTAGQTKNKASGGSYVSDTEFLGLSLAEQTWLFSEAPIADLVDQGLADSIRDEGVYSRNFVNRYSLRWNRPSPGRLSDLWTPNSLDAWIQRDTRTDATTTADFDEHQVTVTAGFSALNMFGAFGVQKKFTWFEQDEYSQLYSWNSRWGSGYYVWSLDLWHSAMFFFSTGGTFVTENTFHYDSPSIAGTGEVFRDNLRLLWKRPGRSSFVRDMIANWTKRPLTTRREDSLTFGYVRDTAVAVSLGYDHTLITGIGVNSEVLMTAGTTLARAATGIVNLQIRLSLGGKLTY